MKMLSGFYYRTLKEKGKSVLTAKLRFDSIPDSEIRERLARYLEQEEFTFSSGSRIARVYEYYPRLSLANDGVNKTLYVDLRHHGFDVDVQVNKVLKPEEMLNLRRLDEFVRTGRIE